MNKKGFKDRAIIRKRMVLTLWFIIAVFSLLIIRLSYIMLVKREEYSVEQKINGQVKLGRCKRGRITEMEMN